MTNLIIRQLFVLVHSVPARYICVRLVCYYKHYLSANSDTKCGEKRWEEEHTIYTNILYSYWISVSRICGTHALRYYIKMLSRLIILVVDDFFVVLCEFRSIFFSSVWRDFIGNTTIELRANRTTVSYRYTTLVKMDLAPNPKDFMNVLWQPFRITITIFTLMLSEEKRGNIQKWKSPISVLSS